jgi:hypothetical protein
MAARVELEGQGGGSDESLVKLGKEPPLHALLDQTKIGQVENISLNVDPVVGIGQLNQLLRVADQRSDRDLSIPVYGF